MMNLKFVFVLFFPLLYCLTVVELFCFREAMLKADTLLTQKHGIVRLDNIWGIGGGLRPVKYLVKQVVFKISHASFPNKIKKSIFSSTIFYKKI